MFTRLLLTAALGVGLVSGCVFDHETSSSALDSDYEEEGCTLTQGFWKTHPESWPVDSLSLGSTSYSAEQLLAILQTPVRGNGLLSLGHQLIAAKLNVAAGAGDGDISDAIADADAAIGDLVIPPVGGDSIPTADVAGLVGALDDYNNGVTGPGHCDDGPPPPPEPYCGDGTVDEGEDCDDGNNDDGDGCNAYCVEEAPPPPPEPYCGDGTVDAGEACDDGNTADGDGCSATCQHEDHDGHDHEPGEPHTEDCPG